MRDVVSASFSMMQGVALEFRDMRDLLIKRLRHTVPINRGKWQSEDVSQSDAHSTYELPNVTFIVSVPGTVRNLQEYFKPDLPWAEDHFLERVGGEPLNPAPSYRYWPYHSPTSADHFVQGGTFSHTYPERMWPKRANPDEIMTFRSGRNAHTNTGIRFAYGDLDDVVRLLRRDPFTRQAYLPIWFPEDTGAVWGQRVPCTLGYHFIRRGQSLDVVYFIRSCDVYRHFTNDAYMAARLCQWVVEKICDRPAAPDNPVWTGNLTMHISNLHLLKGDVWRLDQAERTCS